MTANLKQRLYRTLRAVRNSLTGPAPAADPAPGRPAGGYHMVYFPAFAGGAEDPDFTDHYYRILWYLHPIADELAAITIPYRGAQPPTAGPLPHHFDPEAQRFAPVVEPLLRFVRVESEEDLAREIESADVVMCWQTDPQGRGRLPDHPLRDLVRSKRYWRVDHANERNAGSFYLMASSQLDPESTQDLEESRQKFAALPETVFSERGYIFGTGPRLQDALGRDFSDGVSIACNSMVKNTALMQQLNPPVIAVADPIFHSGVSSYAGKFRRFLTEALDTYPSTLFVPMRDYRVYMQNFDRRFTDRIIGIPYRSADMPNLDLREDFVVTTTGNVMTLFLIPLACTFFETIYTAGFDGRPLEEDDYFWKHDPKSQITDEMDNIRVAHPAFFAIDYNDYYLEHIDLVARWLDAAEARGHRFINLTASYVPALRDRTAGCGEGYTPIESTILLPSQG